MAISYSYNTAQIALQSIFRTTNGGTTWSADIGKDTTDFDYFDDNAVVDDAIYFTLSNSNAQASDFTFNVGTPIIADSITLVWEYSKLDDSGSVVWAEFEDLEDDTNGFTTLGSNRVKFPLQWRPFTMTLNGLTRIWFRCRISAVTNITEGGANTADTVKRSDGRLTVSGGETTPVATFQTIYDWMTTNYPYISLSKSKCKTFDFTKIAIKIDGRTESFGEVIELGQDCRSNTTVGANEFNYLTSGVREGDRGYDGSTFIINGRGNSHICTLGSETNLYGCVFKRGASEVGTGNYPGYFNVRGTLVDTSFEVSPYAKSFPAGYDNVNVRLNSGIMITGDMSQDIYGLTYMSTAADIFHCVPGYSGFTITNFEWGFFNRSSADLFYFYYYGYRSDEYVANFINPVTPLGSYSDDIRPYRRIVTGPYEIETVKWYRAGSGTFEDYTTEASDSTENNFPLYGDVGDMLYIKVYGINKNANFFLERNDTTNDYEYRWEYYNKSGSGTSWVPGWSDLDDNVTYGGNNIIDGTNGLANTGYFLSSVYAPTTERIETTTVDGESGYWMRAVITKKGSGTPMANKIRRMYVTGSSPWKINQKYSMDIKLVDDNYNAINGALVTCTYEDGTEAFSINSGSDGTIERQLMLSKSFEPTGDPAYLSTALVKETEHTSFNLLITKDGLGIFRLKNIPLTKKVDWVIKLGPGTETKIYNSTIYNSTIY